jgi:hypothetical protein
MRRCERVDQANTATHNAPVTRRTFMGAVSSAALSVLMPRGVAASFPGSTSTAPINPRLLSSPDELWNSLEALNQGGVPRFTGNDAHRKLVDMLHDDMQNAGLDVVRDSYIFPRWQVRKWSLTGLPASGGSSDLPTTFYYPHSGQTDPAGVTASVAYVGKISSDGSSKPDLSSDLKGKIVFVDYEIVPTDYNTWYKPWNFYPSTVTIPPQADGLGSYPHDGWSLKQYKDAGAVGVVFGWTNVSDEQATGQNWPFGQPLQGIPALLVGREVGSKIRHLAQEGGQLRLTLEADVFQNSGTDSLVATLPGATRDEVLIVHTHTDGPNAIQENGGVPLVALAKYFAKLPASRRKRTLVFSLITGHDNSAYLPGKQGSFIDRHPDLVKNAVAALTIEHIGCRDYHDDPQHTRYVQGRQDEMSYAMTHHQQLATLELDSVSGTADRRVAIVEPLPTARYLGIGGSLAATGMPTLGYFGAPSYLNIVAPDGCISKLDKTRAHGQLEAYARLLHKLDVVDKSDLKWLPPTPRRAGASSG